MSSKIKQNKMLQIWGLASIFTAIICVFLRILCLTFFYDSNIGYYDSGAVLPIIAQALPIVFVVIALAAWIIPSLRPQVNSAVSCKRTNSFAIFPAVGFSVYTLTSLIGIFNTVASGLSVGIISLISFATTVCAAVFFCLIFLGKAGTGVYVGMGTALIARLLLMLAECYFDIQVQMNAPNKTIFQFAVISAMLLTVNELRVGQAATKPMFHLFSASVAVVFTTLSSVPSIISYFAGNMPQNYNILFYDLLLLLFAIYATARLCQLCFFHSGDELTECSDENNTSSTDE